MSDPIVKGIKRSSTRPVSRQSSSKSPSKARSLTAKAVRPKPRIKTSTAEKAPARKATKSNASAKGITTRAAATRHVSSKNAPSRKGASAKPTRTSAKNKAVVNKSASAKPHKKSARPAALSKTKASPAKAAKPAAARKAPATTPLPTLPRQPTRDEAAALQAFERAHREFTRGRFADARSLFRALIEKHLGGSEVTARARTYLTIVETRLRTESTLPRDADSLYDRGVIELNRGEFVAAQEMFERALKREPDAAHVHYGLAAARARLGSVATALESLQRALDIQPKLRARAQHDQDLSVLRNEPEFERLVFASRF